MQPWAHQEVGHAQLGDRRLSQRLVRIVSDLSDHPEASVPQASGDWAATKGLGPIDSHQTPGLHQQVWARDPAQSGKSKKRHAVPISEKES